MPLYDYKCPSCQRVVELLLRSSDSAEARCEHCDREMVRQLSAPVFRLKGSGWYETDFKAGARRNIAGDSQSAEKSASDQSSSAASGTSAAGESGKSASSEKAASAAVANSSSS